VTDTTESISCRTGKDHVTIFCTEGSRLNGDCDCHVPHCELMFSDKVWWWFYSDYKVWGHMQEKMCHAPARDVDASDWHVVWDAVINHWRVTRMTQSIWQSTKSTFNTCFNCTNYVFSTLHDFCLTFWLNLAFSIVKLVTFGCIVNVHKTCDGKQSTAVAATLLLCNCVITLSKFIQE